MKYIILITLLFSGISQAKRFNDDLLIFGKPGDTTNNKEFYLGLGGIRWNESLDVLEQTVDGGQNWGVFGGSGFNSPLTTKGDILVYDTDNNRKAAGADGTFLQYNSNEADGFAQVSFDINFPESIDTPIRSDNKIIKRITFDLHSYSDGDILPASLGHELFTNFDFSAGDITGYTQNGGSASVSSGVLTYTRTNFGDHLYQDIPTTINSRYQIIADFAGSNNGYIRPFNGSLNGSSYGVPGSTYASGLSSETGEGVDLSEGAGETQFQFIAQETTTGVLVFADSNPETATYNSVSVREMIPAKNIISVKGDYETASGKFAASETNGVFINSSGQLEIEKSATTVSGGQMIIEYVIEE